MSTSKDMLECELRDAFGNPVSRPIAWPVANVRAPLTGDINQNTDNSTNKPLPWVALGCFAGGMGFVAGIVALLVVFVAGPAYIASEVRAARAEMRGEFADRNSKVQAEVDVAKYESSLAKTIAQRLDEKDKLRSK